LTAAAKCLGHAFLAIRVAADPEKAAASPNQRFLFFDEVASILLDGMRRSRPRRRQLRKKPSGDGPDAFLFYSLLSSASIARKQRTAIADAISETTRQAWSPSPFLCKVL
jgi:hypothetical protein